MNPKQTKNRLHFISFWAHFFKWKHFNHHFCSLLR